MLDNSKNTFGINYKTSLALRYCFVNIVLMPHLSAHIRSAGESSMISILLIAILFIPY